MNRLKGFWHTCLITGGTFVAIACVFLGTAVTAGAQGKTPGPSVNMLTPKGGENFSPGDQVNITWKVDWATATSPAGCEQEIYLSLDGGKSVAARITPEMAPTTFSYQWTVPNMPSKKAVLVLNYGCETAQDAFEASHPQKQARFKILPAQSGYEEVVLDSAMASSSSAPSRQVNLKWHSTVSNVDSFDVLVSYDRGAHFNAIGQTSSQEFDWDIDKSLSGVLTFKVIARRTDGGQVESVTNPNLAVVVGRGQ
jgi:hypothetical protein